MVLVDRIFETKKYSSVCVSNFQPIYRSVCRLAGKGDQRIGIIGGLPRLLQHAGADLRLSGRLWRTVACRRMSI